MDESLYQFQYQDEKCFDTLHAIFSWCCLPAPEWCFVEDNVYVNFCTEVFAIVLLNCVFWKYIWSWLQSYCSDRLNNREGAITFVWAGLFMYNFMWPGLKKVTAVLMCNSYPWLLLFVGFVRVYHEYHKQLSSALLFCNKIYSRICSMIRELLLTPSRLLARLAPRPSVDQNQETAGQNNNDANVDPSNKAKPKKKTAKKPAARG